MLSLRSLRLDHLATAIPANNRITFSFETIPKELKNIYHLHLHTLINPIDFSCLNRSISLVSQHKISSSWLAIVATLDTGVYQLVENPDERSSCNEPHMLPCNFLYFSTSIIFVCLFLCHFVLLLCFGFLFVFFSFLLFLLIFPATPTP